MKSILAVTLALVVCSTGGAAAANWAVSCGDGRVDRILDDFAGTWTFCCTADPTIPAPVQRTITGCSGNGLAVDYDLRNVSASGDSWVVITKTLASPIDLTAYTHLRVAMKGSNPNSHERVEVKLKDQGDHLFAISLKSVTDLPEWRAVLIDLRELAGSGTLDLAHIASLEIGITRCNGCEVFDNPAAGGPADEHTGTLSLDEFAAVNLAPGAANRRVQSQFSSVTANAAVAAAAASGLLANLVAAAVGSWIPAWFPEATPNFNSYTQAEALLVFVYEYERTGSAGFRDAARNLATRLIALQIPTDRRQAGAWFTGYNSDGTGSGCNGDESAVADIDRCQWVGNVGWVLIALGRLDRSGFYTDTSALRTAISRGADWLVGQPAQRGNTAYPDLISLGIEGNVSAYFGLRAAGRRSAAKTLATAILQFGWDSLLHRMKVGVGAVDYVTATDVAGSWGATFLRANGRSSDALESQGFTSSLMRTTSFDGTVAGFGDIGGPYTPSVEFVAQAASAGIADADYVLQQMLPLQQSDGVFKGARDHWYGGTLEPWVTTMTGVSPTAWMYFALTRNDPLLDLAPAFTDDPIVARETMIRAVHVTELRSRVDTVRQSLNLGAFSWTDAALTAGGVIRAQHITDLRQAIADCYAALNLTGPTYSDASLTTGMTVKEVHLRELRAAVIQIQ